MTPQEQQFIDNIKSDRKIAQAIIKEYEGQPAPEKHVFDRYVRSQATIRGAEDVEYVWRYVASSVTHIIRIGEKV